MITVTIKHSNGQVEIRAFDKDCVTLGRGVGNDLMIEDGGMSRYHLRVSILNGILILNDLNSSNGTFLNSEKITTCVLKPHDEIVVGGTTLKFTNSPLPAAAAVLPPVPEKRGTSSDEPRRPSMQRPAAVQMPRTMLQSPRVNSRETNVYTTDDIFAELQLFKENPHAALKQFEHNHLKRNKEAGNFASSSWRPLQASFEPLFPFLRDPAISRILINGPSQVFIEDHFGLHRTDLSLNSTQFEQALKFLASIDETYKAGMHPYFQATLDDGSKIVGTPPTVPHKEGCLVISCPQTPLLTAVDLVVKGTMSESMLYFLHACIVLRKTILVAGPPRSGTSTVVGALLSLVPETERIAVIENINHLPPRHSNSVVLDSSACDTLDKLSELFNFAQQMMPQRIVIPDSLKGAASHFIDAACAHAPGSIAAIDAISAEVALSRLEALAQNSQRTAQSLREQIRFGVQIIVELAIMPDNTRRVARITEVAALPDGSLPGLHDIFRIGMEPENFGMFSDRFIWPPTFLGQIRAAGLNEAYGLFSGNISHDDDNAIV